MRIELLKELVRGIAGKSGEVIVDLLKDKPNVNEFKIAEKLKITINQTRNILYKLYSQSIVSFTRKKDVKKGWYIYFWTLDTGKALKKLAEFKTKQIDMLQHQLASRQSKRFYSCPSQCVEFIEETAMLHNFSCPECGKLLELSDEKKVKELQNQIAKAKRETALISEELAKFEVEQAKKAARAKKAKPKKKAKAKKKVAKRKAKPKKKVKPKAKPKKKARPKKRAKKAKKRRKR